MKKLNLPALLVVSAASLAGSPAVAGPKKPPELSNDEIKSTVEAHLSDVKDCAREHGAATGKLVVEFGILSNGKVVDNKPKVHSSNKGLDQCIAKAFGTWTFPKPRGGNGMIFGAIYPFQFAAPPPPKVGHLDDAVVIKTVQGKQKDTGDCFLEGQKEKKDMGGTVKLGLTISPEGVVTAAEVLESNTGSPKADNCLLAKAKTWQFPKPEGGGDAMVSIPILLAVPAKK